MSRLPWYYTSDPEDTAGIALILYWAHTSITQQDTVGNASLGYIEIKYTIQVSEASNVIKHTLSPDEEEQEQGPVYPTFGTRISEKARSTIAGPVLDIISSNPFNTVYNLGNIKETIVSQLIPENVQSVVTAYNKLTKSGTFSQLRFFRDELVKNSVMMPALQVQCAMADPETPLDTYDLLCSFPDYPQLGTDEMIWNMIDKRFVSNVPYHTYFRLKTVTITNYWYMVNHTPYDMKIFRDEITSPAVMLLPSNTITYLPVETFNVKFWMSVPPTIIQVIPSWSGSTIEFRVSDIGGRKLYSLFRLSSSQKTNPGRMLKDTIDDMYIEPVD